MQPDYNVLIHHMFHAWIGIEPIGIPIITELRLVCSCGAVLAIVQAPEHVQARQADTHAINEYGGVTYGN